MHVLVEDREEMEIDFLWGKGTRPQAFDGAVESRLHVTQSLLSGRQAQVPAGIVDDIGGIVHRVSALEQRSLLAQVATDPELLKPGHVPDLPERRVDDREARADHLLVVKIRDQRECPAAALSQELDHLGGGQVRGIGKPAGGVFIGSAHNGNYFLRHSPSRFKKKRGKFFRSILPSGGRRTKLSVAR